MTKSIFLVPIVFNLSKTDSMTRVVAREPSGFFASGIRFSEPPGILSKIFPTDFLPISFFSFL